MTDARSLIRKWYRTEAALASADGYVKNHERGEVIPPHNPVCTRVLQSREGFRRCNLSVKTLVSRTLGAHAEAGPSAPATTHACHLGLGMLGAQVGGDGDVVFCCGVSMRAIDGVQRRTMADKLVTIGLEPQALAGYEQIPIVDAPEADRLADMLRLAARELATNPAAPTTIVEQSPLETEQPTTSLKDQVRQFERELITKGLIRTHWNRLKLARLLGISRTTLLAKMAEFGLHDAAEAVKTRRRWTGKQKP